MSKAILVMNMPRNCKECLLCEKITSRMGDCKITGRSMYLIDKPSSCPLRKLPSKDTKSYFPDEYSDGHRDGYNACIDEILRK